MAAPSSGSQRGTSDRLSLRPRSREDNRFNGSALNIWFQGGAAALQSVSFSVLVLEKTIYWHVSVGSALEERSRRTRSTFSPSFSLESSRSRGHSSRYETIPPSAQRPSTAPTHLHAQRVPTQVPAAMLEPALLPGPGMPAGSPPLASGSPPGKTTPRRPRQSPACPGRETAPPARQNHAQSH
jgi:hypothetical protein